MRLLLVSCLSLFFLVASLACAGLKTSPAVPSVANQTETLPPPAPLRPGGKPVRDLVSDPVAPVHERPAPLGQEADFYPFGEEVRCGEVVVKVRSANSTTQGGQYYGRYNSMLTLTILFTLENKHAGKILEWDGWQNSATAEDEHGNTFARLDLTGWSNLPGNVPEDRVDFKTRLAPGVTHTRFLFFQYAPPATSHEMTITVPLGGKVVRFRGKHTR